MRHQVLLFLTVLLGRVERPLLPHVAVHQPIQVQGGSPPMSLVLSQLLHVIEVSQYCLQHAMRYRKLEGDVLTSSRLELEPQGGTSGWL